MKFTITICFLSAFSLTSIELLADTSTDAMILIPAGNATIGSNKIDTESLSKRYGSKQEFFTNEHPQHTRHLNAYYIDQTEVSNRDYLEYIKATGKGVPRHWISNGYALSLKKEKIDTLQRQKLLEIFSNHIDTLQNNKALTKTDILKTINNYWKNLNSLPIENISWHQANAYCESVGKRLPNEAEWELAAGGIQHLEFPWGNDWRAGWSNTIEEDWPYNTAPVGSYKTDKSPYGVYDLAGNVQEWVSDWYQAYPNSKDYDPDYGHTHRIVRGGGYGSIGHYALPIFSRSSYRGHLRPDTTQAGVGFRCAKDK